MHCVNDLLSIWLCTFQWDTMGCSGGGNEEEKLFTTGEVCLVHVKLWPAVHCLWCLSFNRQVDTMNESGPPSATPEKGPVLSEFRITLEPLSQSHRSPREKCRPWRRRGASFCFPETLMKFAWSVLEGLAPNCITSSPRWLLASEGRRELESLGQCVCMRLCL